MKDELFLKLTKDLRSAVTTMNDNEVRFLVDSYLQMQENRLRANGQIRSMDKSEAREPHVVLDWLSGSAGYVENQIMLALGSYAKSQPMGKYALEVKGIGPVLATGLLAHIDITKAPTVGHIWAFAGLANQKWDKGQKRPWNAALKVICYKIGESFIKLWNDPESLYGRLIKERKAKEWAANMAGGFAEQAGAKLKAGKFDKSTNAWKWYSGKVSREWASEIIAGGKSFPEKVVTDEQVMHPMLPPAQIHARARRYGVKIFLSHWHEQAWWYDTGTAPPKPFAIEHGGHAHYIEPEVPIAREKI